MCPLLPSKFLRRCVYRSTRSPLPELYGFLTRQALHSNAVFEHQIHRTCIHRIVPENKDRQDYAASLLSCLLFSCKHAPLLSHKLRVQISPRRTFFFFFFFWKAGASCYLGTLYCISLSVICSVASVPRGHGRALRLHSGGKTTDDNHWRSLSTTNSSMCSHSIKLV